MAEYYGSGSKLTDVFQLILAQQEAEERKVARGQEMSLSLLTLQLNKEQKELDREATLLDRQIARNEKRYDKAYDDLETSKTDYQDITGSIYKLPEKDKKGGSIEILKDTKGAAIESSLDLLNDMKSDIQGMRNERSEIDRASNKAKLLGDFYKGYGHDYTGGIDPARWDMGDFSDEELEEIMEYVFDKIQNTFNINLRSDMPEDRMHPNYMSDV